MPMPRKQRLARGGASPESQWICPNEVEFLRGLSAGSDERRPSRQASDAPSTLKRLKLPFRVWPAGVAVYWHCMNASGCSETAVCPVTDSVVAVVFISDGLQSLVPPEPGIVAMPSTT